MTWLTMEPPLCTADGPATLPNKLPTQPDDLRRLLSEVRERVKRHRDTVDMRLESAIVQRMSEVGGNSAALDIVLHVDRLTSRAGTRNAAAGRKRRKARRATRQPSADS